MARRRIVDPNSLIVVLARRVGMIKSGKVLAFMAAWAIATEHFGRPPESVEEYAAYWKMSVPSAYREQRLFREALPSESTPTRVCESLRKSVAEQMETRKAQRDAKRQRDVVAAALATLRYEPA